MAFYILPHFNGEFGNNVFVIPLNCVILIFVINDFIWYIMVIQLMNLLSWA